MNKMLKQAENDYDSDKVSSCGKDQIGLHIVITHLLQGSFETILPSGKLTGPRVQ